MFRWGCWRCVLMQRFIHDPHWIATPALRAWTSSVSSFMSLWLGCQEVLLDKGQEDDWFGSHFIVLMAVLAVIGLMVFVVREISDGQTVRESARAEKLQLQPGRGAHVFRRA